MQDKKLNILICPLDWGLGHATRCAPVIRKFMDAGFDVSLAADRRPYDFLKQEFPSCRIIRFPGFQVFYQKKTNFLLSILAQLPKILSGIRKEHLFLEKILKEEKFDIIFSDNRYGLWTKKSRTIFMTHQLEVMIPASLKFISPLVNFFIHRMIRKFDECWVPDFLRHNGLAGSLSHPSKLSFPVSYVGILSRFSNKIPFAEQEPELFNLLIILSGPEPQRTILEEKLFSQLEKSSLKAIIIQGKTEKNDAFDLTPTIRVYSHLDTVSLKKCFLQSEMVICRSGYSGIMDLVSMGKKAILIPTPGQTEQEYLSRYLMEKKIFFSISQEKFDLLYAIEMTRNYPGMVIRNDYRDMDERIKALKTL